MKGILLMPRKDSPYFVKHDPNALPRETQPWFTAASHAFRYFHPKRYFEFVCWCLLQMEPPRVVEVLRLVSRAYQITEPGTFFRSYTDEEVVQATIDVATSVENTIKNP